MDIEIRTPWDHSVEICPSGELDLASAPELRLTLEEISGRGIRRVVVDLSSVSFMDAAGLTPLLELSDALQIVVRRPSRPAHRLLQLCGFDGWLDSEAGTAPVETS